MRTTTILVSLFITLGVSHPMFPVARPYIPSGLGPLPAMTTNAYIAARANVNDADSKIATGPIPDKWKHTHGKLSQEPEAEKRYMGRECGEGIACAGEVQPVERFLDGDCDEGLLCANEAQLVKEVLREREMGDCEEGMWGC